MSLGLIRSIDRWLTHWFTGILLASSASLGGVDSGSTPDAKSIVVLGDSLAAGYGLDPAEAFPALLQEKIDLVGWKFHVVNAGVSGDTTAGALRRLDWVLKPTAAVLMVELGGNDGLRGIPVAETKKNLLKIVQRARQKNAKIQVILAGMQMPPNLGSDYTTRFKEIFREVAQEERIPLVPHLLEGVGGNGALNQADRIHPTAAGQKIVASNVWQVLQPVLAKLEQAGSPAK